MTRDAHAGLHAGLFLHGLCNAVGGGGVTGLGALSGPPRCICCGKIVSGADGLCAECFNEVSFITKPYCAKCGHPFDEAPGGRQMLCGTCLRKTRTPFRLSRSALRYDEFSKNMLLSFKFMDKTKTPRFLPNGSNWPAQIFSKKVST